MPPTTFDFDKEIGALKTPAPQQGGFDFSKELGVPPTGGLAASAKQMVGQTIKGAGQVGADFIPGVSQDNAVSQYGQSVVDANPTAIGSLKDIAARPLTAATEAVGNAIPPLGSIVGLRALGTAVTAAAPFTGVAAPATAAVGQAISWGGPLIAAALPSYSGIRDAQMENGAPTTTKDKAVAGAGALASGAIELVGGPQTRIIKAISGGLERKAGESALKAAGKEAFKSGLEEAGEELVQNPIEQLASYQNPTSAANIEQTLFGGAMGFIGGGIAGGGMQAVAGRQQEAAPAAEDRDTRTTEAVQAKALEGMVNAPVVVSNGQAYVQTGEGDFVVAPLDKLTQHFATGGTLENVNTEALTADSLNSLQTQLDDSNNPVDLGYLTKLRNSRTELIQAGVNKQDVDTMILNNTENTPGRREYVAQLLASGQPDPTAIQEIGSGKIDSPNAPLQAEWQRQEELALETNRRNFQRLQETEQRIQDEAVQREKQAAATARQEQADKELVDYWQSIGAIDTPEEGRAQLANIAENVAAAPTPIEQQTATPVGPPPTEVLPPSPSAAPLTGVAPQQSQPQEVQNGQVQEGRNAPQVEPTQTREDLLRDERIRATSGAVAPALASPPQTREDLLRDERIRATSGAAAPALASPPQTREDLLRDERIRVGSTSKTPVSFISTGESAEEFLLTRPAPPIPAPVKKDVAKKVAPQPTTIEEMLDTTSSAKRAAMWLAKNAKSPVNAAIARRLSSVIGGDIKLVLVQPGVKVKGGIPTELRVSNGVYWTTRRTVYIRGNGFTDSNGANEVTVLHELLHAATARRLDFGRRGANKDTDLGRATRALFALQAQVADVVNAQVRSGEFDSSYSEEERRVTTLAASNVDELVSYGLSNPVFQGVLSKIQIKGESAFTRFTKAIVRLLGLKPSDSSALARLIDVTEGVLSNPEPIVINGLFVAQDSVLQEAATASVKQGQKSLLGKVADIAAGQKVEQAPRWLAVSPLHFLVQTVGRKIPQVQQLSRHLEEANHISETMVSEAMQYYTEALDTKQQDKINRVAGVSSFNRMLPWAPITEQDWVPQDAATRAAKLQGAEMRWKAAGMDKSTGKSFIAAYNEASKAYTSLDEKAQTVYQTIVQHMQQIREREKNNLRAYIERTTVGDEALKEQLLQRYRATFNDVSGAYWPLNRVGDFRLEYVDIDGVRTVTHHSTDAERGGVIESLVADGVDRDTIMESYKDKRPRSEVAIPSELMQQLTAAVYKQKMSDVSPEDYAAVADAKDAAQAVVDDMNQIWLRWQPETSALKNAVQRRNVKGFSEDMLRSYLDYTQRHAGSIAWSEQGRKVEDTLKSLADDIRESRKTPGNKDATFKGMVLNDLRNRVQALRTAKIGPVASTLGRLGTAFYMTSPSTAVVQMTQLPILTLPKMATMYKSWGKASAAMARGVQQAFSSKFAKDKLFGDMNVDALHDMMRSTVTEEMEGKGQAAGKGLGEPLFSREEIEARYKQLTPYQQQLFVLREALARNLLDISAAHEAFALTQGKNPNSKLNKAFKYAMLPMQLSEMASRKAAILSSMALSQDEASKDTPGSKKGFYEIMRDVSEVVNDTLYSYAKSNKPAVLQGGTARVLAMFQWYRIMTALRIGMLFKRSIAAETPEMKSAARKEFIGIMGMTGALAGAIGMPMTQLVFAALDALADDDEPRDSELEFRNWAAERLGPQWGDILVHGLPSTLGVDLSRRIGLDNIYGSQSQAPERLHGKELAAWWAANQLGPIFGIVQGAFQGYDLMVNKGEYAKGLEAAVPKPIRDVLKATRVMEDGELTSTSGKKIIGEDKLTGDAAILLALGLNPAEVSQAQSASMSRSTLSTKMTERRGRLIRDAVDAITGEGDRDEALAAVRAFNKKMPAFAISGGDIRTALVRGIKESSGVQSKRDALIARQFSVPTY